jgi:hypothetical protein
MYVFSTSFIFFFFSGLSPAEEEEEVKELSDFWL